MPVDNAHITSNQAGGSETRKWGRCSGFERPSSANRFEQSEVSERLLNRRDLFWWLGDTPGAVRPNISLQCAIQALSGTKPCWREIHFWIS